MRELALFSLLFRPQQKLQLTSGKQLLLEDGGGGSFGGASRTLHVKQNFALFSPLPSEDLSWLLVLHPSHFGFISL